MPEPTSYPPDPADGRRAALLRAWCTWAESGTRSTPDAIGAYFGNGFNHWGVQTNQKAIAAFVAGAECQEGANRQRWV